MAIESISVFNFRSHKKYSISLSEKTNILVGKNGSGKTSLIEALFITLQGSSFRGVDRDIVSHGEKWYRVETKLSNDSNRIVTFDSSKETGRKKFIIDQKTSYRLSQKDKQPIVLFEPDDLRLLSGSPARRRQFVDRLISQTDPIFHQAITKYERALKQRNNLLKKQNISSDELFVWNLTLSEYGSYIISERIAVIEKINQTLTTIYNSIASSSDTVSIHYQHTLIGDIKQKLLSELTSHNDKDKILGFTSVGPHRHDIIINLNDKLASATASRGENRSIILALKFIEVEIIKSILDQDPLILFDDVFSELDESRQENILGSNYQTIITTTSTVVGKKSTKIIKIN